MLKSPTKEIRKDLIFSWCLFSVTDFVFVFPFYWWSYLPDWVSEFQSIIFFLGVFVILQIPFFIFKIILQPRLSFLGHFATPLIALASLVSFIFFSLFFPDTSYIENHADVALWYFGGAFILTIFNWTLVFRIFSQAHPFFSAIFSHIWNLGRLSASFFAISLILLFFFYPLQDFIEFPFAFLFIPIFLISYFVQVLVLGVGIIILLIKKLTGTNVPWLLMLSIVLFEVELLLLPLLAYVDFSNNLNFLM